MAYEPTNWKSGDVVTSAKLNKLEQGVAGAGGTLVITIDGETSAFDKTWQEINNALLAGQIVLAVTPFNVGEISVAGSVFFAECTGVTGTADDVQSVEVILRTYDYETSGSVFLTATADAVDGYPVVSWE